MQTLQAAIVAGIGVGDRVELIRPVDRYPHFLAPAGLCGTVTELSEDAIAVKLDAGHGLEDLAAWDDCVIWAPSNADGEVESFLSSVRKITLSAEALAEGALDAACRYIQDRLGVKTGDVAGVFFSGVVGDEVKHRLAGYVQLEKQYLEEASSDSSSS
ncbi:MAG: hypothetical protein QJR02_01495 [Sinobacteraceae bacterium]|nr:hypothetical protein [Nevskiaceae bacterium]